jgi:hypothetical protein
VCVCVRVCVCSVIMWDAPIAYALIMQKLEG